jgi:hypothetical protein
MVDGTWWMVHGGWYMVDGTWWMVHGGWYMVDGTLWMVHGVSYHFYILHHTSYSADL